MSSSFEPPGIPSRRCMIRLVKNDDGLAIHVDDPETFDACTGNPTLKWRLDAEVRRHGKRMILGDTLTFYFVIDPTLAEVFKEWNRDVDAFQSARSRESYPVVGILKVVLHALPVRARARYLEEFRSELCELSRLEQVRFAVSIALGIMRLRKAAAQVVEQQG